MAFTLATFLVIFTIVTVYLFLAKIWWFPPAISDFGAQIDAQFHRTLIITGIVFVLAQPLSHPGEGPLDVIDGCDFDAPAADVDRDAHGCYSTARWPQRKRIQSSG